MPTPRLTFFCELETPELDRLITPELLARLRVLDAAVSLAILDLSPQRAEIARRIATAGVPVTAWLLLPKSQGYYFNLDNAPQALSFYWDFVSWVRKEHLVFTAIALDIEPDLRDLTAAFGRGLPRQAFLRRLPYWLGRFFRGVQLRHARSMYRDLANRIRGDGYLVESYQYPFIADERRARTTLLQRLSGMVAVPVDREVLMLYSSFFGVHAPALLASYGRDVAAAGRGAGSAGLQSAGIGIGITGGGVSEPGLPEWPNLSWDELARDLRLAWHFSDQIYIFSLEGCAANGYLERLEGFVWDQPTLQPETTAVDAWRGSIQSGLWFAERLPFILVGLGALIMIARRVKRRSA